MRGLKQNNSLPLQCDKESHPAWVRGLKPKYPEGDISSEEVAPCVGAWIETAGVLSTRELNIESHPAWVRGLKQK